MTASKSLELESFWRAHLDGWRRSDLNQREYCELRGLPLKRFGNWRATLRHEERPAAHLKDFGGVLQVDGYAGFERLTVGGNIVLAACWAHPRRKFYEFHQATNSPIAAEVLRRIADLYAIEKEIRGRNVAERQGTRDIRSRPLVDAMKLWLEASCARLRRAVRLQLFASQNKKPPPGFRE